jgi:hypothetical protein
MITKRGYVVFTMIGVLATTGAIKSMFWAEHFVNSHTVIYNCHMTDLGWTCDTKWKW